MINAVRASEIASLLDHAPRGVEILSLDCFDTLIWRNANVPVDVFAHLPIEGGGMENRIWAEKKARKALSLYESRHEVTIAEIYARMFGEASEAQIAQAVEAEIAAEARHCFAFAPVRELIADAKRRGLKVIIVSDTYLQEPQLRGLIAAAAGQDVADQIDRIFCSCQYGVSKAGGMFMHVLADLGISPAKIVHLGDNREADYVAAQKFGIHGVHFEQFDGVAEQRLRLEAAASTLIERDTRRTVPAMQPHRAQLSLRDNGDPLFQLGHDVMGPIMMGFARWLADEADALAAQTGKTTKLLFLLRDGHLPGEAFKAAFPDRSSDCAMIELSRFTANATGFTDERRIRDYLDAEAHGTQYDVYCRQLLFNRDEIARLSKFTAKRAFIAEILKPANVAKIVRRSERFAQRLFAHLRSNGINDGDSVMLVDLGYNGSVQNAAEHVLRAGMGLNVAGRYLLLREQMLSGLDKKGMIDLRHYDLSALHALSESIALVEQLCTLAQGSVVDYNEKGEPRRGQAGVKNAQSQARDAAQAACIGFVRNWGHGWATTPASWDGECARRMAAASLSRILFLPIASEVELLEGFDHDVNLGTKDVLKIVDPKAAATGMRRRGLFYAKNAMRFYLPGELMQQGLPVTLSVFAGRRFGLDLRKTDFDVGGVKLPVMLIAPHDHVAVEVDAFPTSEGYYQALIPVGRSEFAVGIQMGQFCDWVQIEEASFHEVEEFLESREHEGGVDAAPVFDAMDEQAPGLYKCANEAGFMLVPPPAKQSNEAMMLSLVFRPVVSRKDKVQAVRNAA